MSSTKEKICHNCGEKLPVDSSFCIKCGVKVDEDVQSVEETIITPSFYERNKKIIGSSLVLATVLLLVLFIINSVQISNLKKELLRDWQTVEGEDGAYILCILDFSEDEIEYRLETGYAWMDTTVDTYEYKVVSGNKIKVKMYGDDWETITVKFNDEKNMMTVTPALTSVDDEEQWFNLD